jgi:hypothetical protein
VSIERRRLLLASTQQRARLDRRRNSCGTAPGVVSSHFAAAWEAEVRPAVMSPIGFKMPPANTGANRR